MFLIFSKIWRHVLIKIVLVIHFECILSSPHAPQRKLKALGNYVSLLFHDVHEMRNVSRSSFWFTLYVGGRMIKIDHFQTSPKQWYMTKKWSNVCDHILSAWASWHMIKPSMKCSTYKKESSFSLLAWCILLVGKNTVVVLIDRNILPSLSFE